ncbi:bromodomain-containing protein 7 [Anopheles ziemanni]|uniref:bromodomain-containing protein 7 n=1 Tax=Anopheles coustani TaxID=139045 RepID=UPI00265AB2D8|nr:bromodomain-containing protein 7 [Anopheles coustani]XP_058177361.1 bromodomain-containing protein 7 [Anopheles ziemanni]
MGSKKHKKHKSERREREGGKEKSFSVDRPPSLKLILKVSGNSSTPEHGNDSPAYGIQSDGGSTLFTSSGDYPERHKKSKKKKKKKDREKKHKHHHKEKRHRHRGDDTSHDGEEDEEEEEDFNSVGDESSQAALDPVGVVHYPTVAASSVAVAAVAAVANSSLAAQPVTKPLLPEILLSPKHEPDMGPESVPEPMTEPDGGLGSAGGLVPKEEMTTAPSSVTTEEPLQSPGSMQSSSRPGSKIDFHDTSSSQCPKTPNSDCSGREPRSCVLKLKQMRSPLAKLLDHLLKALEKRDPHQFFAWPVTDDIAPGYSSIILKPMDFSTIRQKIDDNEYNSVAEFSDDFKLMCENAIKYNHSETVYHKAAKKLLHVGARLLQPDNLMRSLRPLMTYMRELTAKELGFELPVGATDGDGSEFHHQHHTADSADEAMAAAVDEGINAQIEEEEKRKQIRLENNPQTKFEAFVDDLTADEVLAQVQSAALNARTKLLKRKSAHKLGFLRQHKDGTTSMKLLLDTGVHEGGEGGPERTVTLGAHTGKLQYGTGQLQGFREDRRNSAKIVKPLNYGAFGSFAPVFDSRFSNLSKEETDMVLNTYGCETGADYAESILRFAMDSPFAAGMAHNLLDVLTNGEHRQTYGKLYETHMQRQEREAVKQTFLDPDEVAEEVRRYADVKIDFDALRSLSSVGVNMHFLDDLERQLKEADIVPQLQQSLHENSDLLQKLHQMQTERLSAPLPAHLSHIQHPSDGELELAGQITSNLTQIAKQLPPSAIAQPHGLRKAMGINTTVGLDVFQSPPPSNVPSESQSPVPAPATLQQPSNCNGTEVTSPNAPAHSGTSVTAATDIDTTPMDMDLEPEPISHHHHQHHPHPHHLPSQQQQQSSQQQQQPQEQSIIQSNPTSSSNPVDIDSELREFLGSSGLSSNGPHSTDEAESSDAACIEQMLLD